MVIKTTVRKGNVISRRQREIETVQEKRERKLTEEELNAAAKLLAEKLCR